VGHPVCLEIWTENSKDVYRSSICEYLIRGRQKKSKSTGKSAEDRRSLQQRHVANRSALRHQKNNAHCVFHLQKCIFIYTTLFFTLATSLSLNIDPNMTKLISLFHRAFQFTICNGPTNALVCNKTLIKLPHIETLKITPTCFDHQLIIIRELLTLVKIN
jgi:hypothetical protein